MYMSYNWCCGFLCKYVSCILVTFNLFKAVCLPCTNVSSLVFFLFFFYIYLLHEICGQCKISMTSTSLKFPVCF